MILKQMTILICMIPENLMAGSLSNQYPLVVRTFSESVPVVSIPCLKWVFLLADIAEKFESNPLLQRISLINV